MKTLWILLPIMLWVTACAPQQPPTQAPVAQTQAAAAETQAFGNSLATSLAGTQTAIAPTASRTPLPPTATATREPSPTPSGNYAFSDVAVKQVSPDSVDITFVYQAKQGAKLDNVEISAWPEGCGKVLFNMSFRPYDPAGSYSGRVSGDDAIRLSLDKPGKCEVTALDVFFFVPNSSSGNLYQAVFKLPFKLEKTQ